MTNIHWFRVSVILILALLNVGCGVYAVTSGRVAIREERGVAHFSERDRSMIGEYFRAHPSKKTPPGQVKREKLSPGLGRGGTLPPGLQGRPLPRELESRLTALPTTQARILLGHDVVLMQRDNRLVLDILHGVAD